MNFNDNLLTDYEVYDLMMVAEGADSYGQYPRKSKEEYIDWMTNRTKKAAVAVINLMEHTKASPAINVIRFQIMKSATSSAANYRAACRARSKNEFFAKMSIVVEETDETVFWLEMLNDADVAVNKAAIQNLHDEWQQLLKIMAKARSNVKR